MNDFEHVLQKVEIEQVISKKLGRGGKRVGQNIDFGECPFCNGHDCFRVNSEKQFYNCFQCDAGGNAITFVRQFDKLLIYFQKACVCPIAMISIDSVTAILQNQCRHGAKCTRLRKDPKR